MTATTSRPANIEAACLRRMERGGLTLECRAEGAWYVFAGSPTGTHRLCRDATPEDRLGRHDTKVMNLSDF